MVEKKRVTMYCRDCDYYGVCTEQMKYYCARLKQRLVERGIVID